MHSEDQGNQLRRVLADMLQRGAFRPPAAQLSLKHELQPREWPSSLRRWTRHDGTGAAGERPISPQTEGARSPARLHSAQVGGASKPKWNPTVRVDPSQQHRDDLALLLVANLKRMGYSPEQYHTAIQNHARAVERARVKAIAQAEHDDAATVWWYCTHVMPFEARQRLEADEHEIRVSLLSEERDLRNELWSLHRQSLSYLHEELAYRAEAVWMAARQARAEAEERTERHLEVTLRALAGVEAAEMESRALVESEAAVMQVALADFAANLRELVWEMEATRRLSFETRCLKLVELESHDRRSVFRIEARERVALVSLRDESMLAVFRSERLALSESEEDARAELWCLQARIRAATARARDLSLLVERLMVSESHGRTAICSEELWSTLVTEESQCRDSVELHQRNAAAGVVSSFAVDGVVLSEYLGRRDLDTESDAAFEELSSARRTAGAVAALVLLEAAARDEICTLQLQSFQHGITAPEMAERRAMMSFRFHESLASEEASTRLLIHQKADVERSLIHALWLLVLSESSGRHTVLHDEVSRRKVARAMAVQNCEALARNALRAAERTCFNSLIQEADQLQRTKMEGYRAGLGSARKFIGLTAIERVRERCLQVEALHIGGPAHAAGVQLNDTLTAVGPSAVRTRDDMRKAIAEHGKVGHQLQLTLIRTVEAQPTELIIVVVVKCSDDAFSAYDFYFDAKGPKLGASVDAS